MQSKCWYVYIVLCSDLTYYTGITTNVTRRVRQHNGELIRGSKYCSTRRPVHLVWTEPQPNRSQATKKENNIKKMSHAQKKHLIGGS